MSTELFANSDLFSPKTKNRKGVSVSFNLEDSEFKLASGANGSLGSDSLAKLVHDLLGTMIDAPLGYVSSN